MPESLAAIEKRARALASSVHANSGPGQLRQHIIELAGLVEALVRELRTYGLPHQVIR